MSDEIKIEIQLDPETMATLKRQAEEKQMPVEEYAGEALSNAIILGLGSAEETTLKEMSAGRLVPSRDLKNCLRKLAGLSTSDEGDDDALIDENLTDIKIKLSPTPAEAKLTIKGFLYLHENVFEVCVTGGATGQYVAKVRYEGMDADGVRDAIEKITGNLIQAAQKGTEARRELDLALKAGPGPYLYPKELWLRNEGASPADLSLTSPRASAVDGSADSDC